MTAESFTIRRCTPRDAQHIAALGARLFIDAYGATHQEPILSSYVAEWFAPERAARALSDERVSVLVAEDSAHAHIAYAHMSACTTELPSGVRGTSAFEIERFYVDASWHGRGVASELMRHCCDEARRRGGDVVWLQVWQQAPRAIAFYTKAGFSIVGEARFQFGAQVDIDHVMVKNLTRDSGLETRDNERRGSLL